MTNDTSTQWGYRLQLSCWTLRQAAILQRRIEEEIGPVEGLDYVQDESSDDDCYGFALCISPSDVDACSPYPEVTMFLDFTHPIPMANDREDRVAACIRIARTMGWRVSVKDVAGEPIMERDLFVYYHLAPLGQPVNIPPIGEGFLEPI